MSCLYILEINTLSFVSLANIFSYSEDCLFVLFMISFAVQKLLSLIKSHLFIFVFISITLEGGSKKMLPSSPLPLLWSWRAPAACLSWYPPPPSYARRKSGNAAGVGGVGGGLGGHGTSLGAQQPPRARVGGAIALRSFPTLPRGSLPPAFPDLPGLRDADLVWLPLLLPLPSPPMSYRFT